MLFVGSLAGRSHPALSLALVRPAQGLLQLLDWQAVVIQH